MEAFVVMRKVMSAHSGLLQRMDRFEITQIEHGQRIEKDALGFLERLEQI